MASWNGSHPQEENHNYSYANSRYPENVESFPASWAYYPPLSVQQNSADAVGQLQSTAFSNQSLQTNFAIPPPSHYLGFGHHFQDMNGINTHINPNEGNLSVASTSSLTPTAGEFVPRQPSELPVTGSGDRKFYSNRFNTSDEYKSSLSSFNSSEQSNMSRRNGPKPETKYYNPVRNLSSQKHETPFNRRRGNGRGGLDGNSVSSNASNMDRIKNDERERLLLEAAAFLTPTNNAELKPEVNSNKSRKSDRKQEDNLEPQANRAFSNSSKSNEYPSSYRNNMKQQYSSSNWKKRSGNNYYNQPNSGTSVLQQRNAVDYTAETYGNSGRKIHNQNRYNNSSNNVTTYRSLQVQHSSPKSNSSGGYNNTAKGDDDSSQRERLTEQLARGTLECLVCCDRVRQHDPVWSCTNCYHVLHLKCIKKWATSSKAESGWRCPACQNVTAEIPEAYYCFCGKVREPEWNRMDAAHSCGQMCGCPRTDKHPDCTHRCTLLCHPGPCPSCVAQVNRSCGCGKMFQIVKCGSDKPLLCGAVCDRVLNCSAHYCKNVCHIGSCTECQEKIIQVCYCKKETREVPCTRDSLNTKEFSCEETCEKTLSCGNHKCSQKCHPGTCPECELTPDKVTRCPCGKTPLKEDEQRSSCLDPVPTCGMKCNKTLNCGQPGEPHTCQLNCHSGPCPVCPRSTSVKCRCGNMFRDIPCKELPTRGTDARCEKKCTKKRSCGKHKCNQLCCIDPDHICPLPCNHQLSCGQHRCEENCHRGRCPPCWRMSFEELFCECGSSVLYPPISCGTRRPECTKPCSRPHPCEHPALHNCHSQPTCPPCTVLTKKYCHGKHELRKSIPCHQEDFSCGLPCNVPLPCGRHNCILPCHKDQCLKEGQNCTQPCTTPRAVCGHNCATPCHEGPCPDTPCKEMVKVTCECGHRSTSRACSDNAKEYQRIATSLLASKMADMQLGHSVDLGDMLSIPSARKMSLKTLECNEECKIIERNRRLAIGLQIRNPDLSAKLTPRYSDYMKQWAKKDPQFCGFVHDKLSELVKLAKESKQKSRSYSFDVMNREKRHFVHEYCEHFGCESVAYDREPKRNVVATAAKDKSWLPGLSLLEVVKRESGQRTIPKPVITSNRVPSERTMDILPVKCSQSQAPAIPEKPAGPSSSEKTGKHEDEIDYFDFS